jgi:beta-RFAP synthase
LHLGFLDPGASLGRAFGSLGLVIEGVSTIIDARRADHDSIQGDVSEDERARIVAHVDRLQQAFGPHPVALTIRQTIPAHSGLGSGTQLALALGAAFAALCGRDASAAGLAYLLGRGGRSGIGIGAFGGGGLLLDGGPAPARPVNGAPPVLSRIAFPDAWRVLLVNDPRRRGLHGDAERSTMAGLAPFPQRLAAHLCHLVLMRILPAAVESDFEPFANGITDLQRTIGAHFAPVQGGLFSSPDVARAIEAVSQHQLAGIGQSSWGPTGFAVLRSEHDARAALAHARASRALAPHLDVAIVRGRNRGATLAWADGTDEREAAEKPAPSRSSDHPGRVHAGFGAAAPGERNAAA